MKKIIALSILILFTLAIANAQDGWVIHTGDNRISVKFPSQPSEVTPGNFTAAANDGTVVCIFTIVDFTKVANIDSIALAPIKDTPEFAAELKAGLRQSLPDVSLGDFTIGKWKGFTSYTSSGLDSRKKKYDIFMFIIGNNLYSLSTVTDDGTLFTTRDEFLASVTLTN